MPLPVSVAKRYIHLPSVTLADEKPQLIKRLPAPLIRQLLHSCGTGRICARAAACELRLARSRFIICLCATSTQPKWRVCPSPVLVQAPGPDNFNSMNTASAIGLWQ